MCTGKSLMAASIARIPPLSLSVYITFVIFSGAINAITDNQIWSSYIPYMDRGHEPLLCKEMPYQQFPALIFIKEVSNSLRLSLYHKCLN